MFIKKFFSRSFKENDKIEYTTGKAIPLEEFNLPELEKYPIWIFALDDEDEYDENQDETWVKPITNSTKVTKYLVEAYILLKVKENGYSALGRLDIKKMILDDLWFWDSENNEWIELQKLDLTFPIHLISIPDIMDQVAVEFTFTKNKDCAEKSI